MLINLPQAQKLEHKADRDSCDTWQHSQSPPPPPRLRKLQQGLSPQLLQRLWGVCGGGVL